MKFLIKKTPENFIRTVNDEISSLLNRHFDSYFPEAAYWEQMDKMSLPIEIEDKGKEFVIKAEIPGIKRENLDIDIDTNCICINAKKEEECNDENKEHSYKKSEFRYGEFSRTVYFPEEVDTENSEASLENGILIINVPKRLANKETKKKLIVK